MLYYNQVRLRRPHPAQNHPIPVSGIRRFNSAGALRHRHPACPACCGEADAPAFLIANSAIRNPSQVAENKRDTKILIANFCPRSAALLEDIKKNALIATPAIRIRRNFSGINHLDFSNRPRTASRPLIEPRTSNLELLIPNRNTPHTPFRLTQRKRTTYFF